MSNLSFATNYACRGWQVFRLYGIDEQGRCRCGNPLCSRPGKHPPAPWKEEATAKLEKVRELFGGDGGDLWNIGIATGKKSGLVAVDIDPRHGGVETWQQLLRQGNVAEETFCVATGGGGFHLYYAWDKAAKTGTNVPGPGIDIRSDGGYVAAPPSRHASGREYTILRDCALLPLPPSVLRPVEKSTAYDDAPPPMSIDRARAMLKHISSASYQTWFDAGVALGRALHGSEEGFELYRQWSDKDYTAAPGDTARARLMRDAYYKVAAMGGSLDSQWLCDRARAGGWNDPRQQQAGCRLELENLVYLLQDKDFYDTVSGVRCAAAAVDALVPPVKTDGGLMKPSRWLMQFRAAACRVSTGEIAGGYQAGYAADEDTGELIEVPGRAVVNTFRTVSIAGPELPPVKGRPWDAGFPRARAAGMTGSAEWQQQAQQARQEAEPFIRHCIAMMNGGDPRNADVFLDYMAYKMQHPADKIRWALVMGGPQGCGKDLAIDACWKAAGLYHIRNISPADLSAPYNEYVNSQIVRISEVADLQSASRWMFNERTKVLIAGQPDTMVVNIKYGGKYACRMRNGVVMTTNHMGSSLHLERGERRYYAIECAMPVPGDATGSAAAEYFDRLYAWLNNGGYAAVGRYLMYYRDTSAFAAGRCPAATAAKEAICDASASVPEWATDALFAMAEAQRQMLARSYEYSTSAEMQQLCSCIEDEESPAFGRPLYVIPRLFKQYAAAAGAPSKYLDSPIRIAGVLRNAGYALELRNVVSRTAAGQSCNSLYVLTGAALPPPKKDAARLLPVIVENVAIQ